MRSVWRRWKIMSRLFRGRWWRWSGDDDDDDEQFLQRLWCFSFFTIRNIFSKHSTLQICNAEDFHETCLIEHVENADNTGVIEIIPQRSGYKCNRYVMWCFDGTVDTEDDDPAWKRWWWKWDRSRCNILRCLPSQWRGSCCCQARKLSLNIY